MASELKSSFRLHRIVVTVEGERDGITSGRSKFLRRSMLGVPANGEELSISFRSRDVVVIPDRDPQKHHQKTNEPLFHPDGRPMLPGQDHAQAIARALYGVAKRVRVLELWNDWPACRSRATFATGSQSGGTVEKLYALIKVARIGQPPENANSDAWIGGANGRQEPTRQQSRQRHAGAA